MTSAEAVRRLADLVERHARGLSVDIDEAMELAARVVEIAQAAFDRDDD